MPSCNIRTSVPPSASASVVVIVIPPQAYGPAWLHRDA
jgi:hypothetical protein